MKLAVFDSGHGGLDYLHAAMKDKLAQEYFYCADLAYMPYGELDQELLAKRCRIIIKKFIDWGADIIVLACNTATAGAIDKMRQEFSIPLIGIEPFVNYVNKMNLGKAKNSRSLGVLVTQSTFESDRFGQLILKMDPDGLTHAVAMPKLAATVEKFIETQSKESLIEDLSAQLLPLHKYQWEKVILGCTHYQLISEFIEKILKIETISATQAIINQTKNVIHARSLSSSFSEQSNCDTFIYWDTRKKVYESKSLSHFVFWRN